MRFFIYLKNTELLEATAKKIERHNNPETRGGTGAKSRVYTRQGDPTEIPWRRFNRRIN